MRKIQIRNLRYETTFSTFCLFVSWLVVNFILLCLNFRSCKAFREGYMHGGLDFLRLILFVLVFLVTIKTR